MHPKLCKRFALASRIEPTDIQREHNSLVELSPSSVRDEAALLLSIADIAKSELGAGGLNSLWGDNEGEEDLPKFPLLTASPCPFKQMLIPRSESLHSLLISSSQRVDDSSPHSPSSTSFHQSATVTRIRSVSVENSPKSMALPDGSRTPSPLATSLRHQDSFEAAAAAHLVTPIQAPVVTRRLPLRKHSLRLSKPKGSSNAAHETAKGDLLEEPEVIKVRVRAAHVSTERRSSLTKGLQAHPPKGIPIKRIMRRKFSWKNYPELEQFLIINREEYLRHSALNYTLQQKQYNNKLTDRLLELATEHGYLFDEKEFSFVTVRDRIRCYFKSYVQSAKKRGILMGYAARKAGLLNEDELEKSVGDDSEDQMMED